MKENQKKMRKGQGGENDTEQRYRQGREDRKQIWVSKPQITEYRENRTLKHKSLFVSDVLMQRDRVLNYVTALENNMNILIKKLVFALL